MASATHVELSLPTLTHLTLTDCPYLLTLSLKCPALQCLRTAGTPIPPDTLFSIITDHPNLNLSMLVPNSP